MCGLRLAEVYPGLHTCEHMLPRRLKCAPLRPQVKKELAVVGGLLCCILQAEDYSVVPENSSGDAKSVAHAHLGGSSCAVARDDLAEGRLSFPEHVPLPDLILISLPGGSAAPMAIDGDTAAARKKGEGKLEVR